MAQNNNNPQQIIRVDGNNCFVEVLSSSFPIGRVLMRFITYDKTQAVGNKFTNNIEIYLTFASFLRLSNAFLNGRLDAALADAKNKAISAGYKYPIPLNLDMGGKSAKKLAAAGKARPDGMSLSRQLKISSGDKFPYLLQAESGPGEEDAKGLIVPRYKQPEQKVLIPLNYDSFTELFLLTTEHIRAYLASTYTMEALHPTPRQQYNQPANKTQANPQQASNSQANAYNSNYANRNANSGQQYNNPTPPQAPAAGRYPTQPSAPSPAPQSPTYTPPTQVPNPPPQPVNQQPVVAPAYSNQPPAQTYQAPPAPAPNPAPPQQPYPTQTPPTNQYPTYNAPPVQQPEQSVLDSSDLDFFNSLAGDTSFI